LSRAIVELGGDRVECRLVQLAQISAPGEILAEQAVGVLVRAALPGAALMVGSGTQQADDPQLAVRDAEATRQPLRIIVDSNARTPASARVLDDPTPTLIAVADDADAAHLEGCGEVLRLPRVDAGLDLELLLKALSERGVRAILLEGGPTLAGSFLARRSDRQGGGLHRAGSHRSALAGQGALNIADAKRFQFDDVVRIGPDVRLTATPLR
jgi:diaminohydroxyphosphoribosylaminopyrimidine deaminase/5-amino-6-(5-phosphoribosylamino)uracil reductase